MRCLSSNVAISPSELPSDADTNLMRHDLADPQPVGLGKFCRESGARRQRLDPPRPLVLRPDFRTPHQVRFADHTDHAAVIINHRQSADVMFDKKLDRRGDVRFGLYGYDVTDHHVHCLHDILLISGAAARQAK
jgi:hypothetical protein